jgi:germination protein M
VKEMKRWLLLSTMVILTLVLFGCGGGKPGALLTDAAAPKTTEEGTGASKEEGAGQRAVVVLYYTDEQLMELIPIKKELQWDNEQEKYTLIFDNLTKAPTTSELSLWEGWKVGEIQLTDGILTVDLFPSSAAVGSSAERLMLLSLLQTMFQFEEIKEIKLLIDGSIAETLAGHLELTTFTRDSMTDL